MSNEQVLKLVFPFLDAIDLATSMSVSKHWRSIASDDYFWKCLCAKRWPSLTKRNIAHFNNHNNPPLPLTFRNLYRTFHKRRLRRALPPPRLSFADLEFFIDVWSGDSLIFSEAVPGPALLAGHGAPLPQGRLCERLTRHLEGPEYKMTLVVDPRFTVSAGPPAVGVSVLAGRRDSNKLACVISKSEFEYVDRSSCRAMAFDFLELSPSYPFVSGIRAWVSLLFSDEAGDGALDVLGIQMDFCDAANSEEEVLWLLDMLDWK